MTAVLPAYNEAQTLGAVLMALLPVAQVNQILVVDDGSTDGTDDVVRSQCALDPRLRLIRLERNAGKAQAMLTGAVHARHDLILFLDADLIGLDTGHIRALIEPVARGNVAMSIARFVAGRRQTNWSHRLMPFLSGQRCLRWSYFADTPGFAEAGWSVEVALSLHAQRHGYPVIQVPWRGVTHRMRPEKRAGLAGYWSHVRMWAEIGRYLVAQSDALLPFSEEHVFAARPQTRLPSPNQDILRREVPGNH
jgi:glycosyltransferase involved in cell wall biosynthesis